MSLIRARFTPGYLLSSPELPIDECVRKTRFFDEIIDARIARSRCLEGSCVNTDPKWVSLTPSYSAVKNESPYAGRHHPTDAVDPLH